jgi:hypothetical protein
MLFQTNVVATCHHPLLRDDTSIIGNKMKPWAVLQIVVIMGWVGTTLLHGFILGDCRRAFQRHRQPLPSWMSSRHQLVSSRRASFTPLSSRIQALNAEKKSGGIESIKNGSAGGLPANFNPFNYQRSPNSNQQQAYNPSSRISLRKSRMQEITNELLQAAASPSASSSSSFSVRSPDEGDGASRIMRSILDENRQFLLEPLESDDAVLDPDSVLYQGGAPVSLSRSERYRLYRSELQERIDRARNGASRQVLQALHDFVREHE